MFKNKYYKIISSPPPTLTPKEERKEKNHILKKNIFLFIEIMNANRPEMIENVLAAVFFNPFLCSGFVFISLIS